ncbi:hypothetical protein PIB30_042710 [Stylosanthes scabra]|uniref:Uncharacterized protein n=1 Tax=Stylosanthes scabra TaxID=79078 RepID=A0ABU6YHP5_9FABA|nr:hypothetical protein [Stylosanthes scabra]
MAQIERNAEVVRAPQPQGMVRTSSIVNKTRIQVPNNFKPVTHKSSSSTSTIGGVTVNVVVTTKERGNSYGSHGNLATCYKRRRKREMLKVEILIQIFGFLKLFGRIRRST